MNIVLVNDDGVHAPGINVLKNSLEKIANVIVVAPLNERSTTGHTLTLDTTIRLEEISDNVYGCSGYPADCSLMAIGYLFKNPQSKYYNQKIDLVISGINRGPNLGQDIFYSGTVAAAREAAFHGIPSIAVSSAIAFGQSDKEIFYYQTASQFIKNLVESQFIQLIESNTLVNINVPWCESSEISGVKVTKTGMRKYSEAIDERVDFRGRKYYWIGGIYQGYQNWDDSDCQAIDQNLISINPLKLCEFGKTTEEIASVYKKFFNEFKV